MSLVQGKCPNCGHDVVKAKDIGLSDDPTLLICSMNMPFQGCGWRGYSTRL